MDGAKRVFAIGIAACWIVAEIGTQPARGAEPAADAVTFVRDGAVVGIVDRAKLATCSIERIEINDPYYDQNKSFWACPLAEVLAMGFGGAPQRDADANFFLRALDGFTKPASGAKLAEPGGYLALSDADRGTPTGVAYFLRM